MIGQQSDIKQRTRYKMPHMYKVIMLNDDYTTMDFVVNILETVFNKTPKDAETIMMKVHNEGKAIVGIYTYDIAKTKINYTTLKAQNEGFPLRLVYQPN